MFGAYITGMLFAVSWICGVLQVETGPNGGYPIQIHLPAEEILIQVRQDQWSGSESGSGSDLEVRIRLRLLKK